MSGFNTNAIYRRAGEDSILAVQIFDQRKFNKRKDQGFLGVINIRVGDAIDFGNPSDRELHLALTIAQAALIISRNAHQRS